MKPNVGMLYPVCAPIATYTPGTGVTYSTGCVVAEARSATLTWNRADGEFYGDDALLDMVNEILAGVDQEQRDEMWDLALNSQPT